MKVSLLQIHLELEEGYTPLASLLYRADAYLDETEKGLELNEKCYKEIPNIHRGNRSFQEYTIQTYTMSDTKVVPDNDDPPPPTPRSKTTSTSEHNELQASRSNTTSTSEHDELQASAQRTIHYFSGNPSVEKTKGIIHLYKDNHLTGEEEGIERSTMLCMLGVPAKNNCQDLQKFLAPARDSVTHIQIIRDSIPSQYMVLIKFKNQIIERHKKWRKEMLFGICDRYSLENIFDYFEQKVNYADEFYREYEGKAYNMLETECTHLVYVAKVESVATMGVVGGYLPVPGLTELPTCPVCLDKMDESVEGILTILCNHSFHANCLHKWEDIYCPVCRYVQTPEVADEQKCFQCESNESLWICLVCGHIGCGRYQQQHAYQHYQQTAHTFSMHLSNKRVWDYTGDNYVHRLLQNKSDGKLVSLDNSEQIDGEKIDSLTQEYTFLLANQLESQRQFFEEKIDFIESDAYERLSLAESTMEETRREKTCMQEKLSTMERERRNVERRYENAVQQVAQVAKDLADEQQMNACLRDNQSMWHTKVEALQQEIQTYREEKESQIADLECQVGDLMKHLEIQTAVTHAEQGVKQDIQGGQVFLEGPPSSPSKGAKKKTKKK